MCDEHVLKTVIILSVHGSAGHTTLLRSLNDIGVPEEGKMMTLKVQGSEFMVH